MSTRCAIGAVLLVLGAVTTSVFAQTWTDVCSNEGRFCVLFPGTPTEDTKTDPSNSATTHIFIFRYQRDILLLMGYTDYKSPFRVERELQLDRDNFLQAVGGTLVASKRTQFERAAGDWLPALEFSGRTTDYLLRSVMIADEQRVYQLAVRTVINANDFTTSERFLNSLRLKPRQ